MLGSLGHRKTNKISAEKIALFSHFDQHFLVSKHAIKTLRWLNKRGCKVIFISTSPDKNIINLTPGSLADLAIHREIEGFYFSSWKIGLGHVRIRNSTSLVVLNDILPADVGQTEKSFIEMERKNLNTWGLSDSFDIKYRILKFSWCLIEEYYTVNHLNIFGRG